MCRKLKLVTFDAMNTLFKVKPNIGQTYCDAVRHLLSQELTSQQEMTVQENFFTVYKNYTKEYPNFGYGKISSESFWQNIISDSLKSTGCKFNEDDVKLVTVYLYDEYKKADKYSIFPDVFSTLSELEKRGVVMGVISNFDNRLVEILGNLKLKQYFKFILCSRIEGVAKPYKDIFKKALSISNIAPDEALHIGDNYQLDYVAAKNCGINAMLVNRTKETVNVPEYDQCSFLTDLLKIV